ncbi:hypothetical protein PR202_gb15761 [Eleusine coracana subsp. coracana]|uniref:Alkaline/neutral invertase n=1 Tax=Eleusine coracana subsp. coracana TaxID=191504 RepID=A0AAV5EYP7_ELECO|nr:hypothetical protein PR202_gb15761 [Eleusine coracana subsp. coracana]
MHMDMAIARVAAPLHLTCSPRPTGSAYPPPALRPGPIAVPVHRRRALGRSVNGGASAGHAKPHAQAQGPKRKRAASVEEQGWELLRESVVRYCGSPVGTIAACDPDDDAGPLNYDQVFIRDFVPSGVAFLLKGEYDIVRNFILHTLQLQSWEKTMDCHSPGQGLMPASFKVRVIPLDGDDDAVEEVLDPDFGEAAIGRVAPVDSGRTAVDMVHFFCFYIYLLYKKGRLEYWSSGLWWIILLRAYGKCSGDLSAQERIDVQTGIKMILKLCLADGFDMFPTLLVTDGSCMIDRRMGIHGHPLEIQKKLNEIYRYRTEEYSYDAVNKFNIYPDQIPSCLATTQQSHAILDLIESKWSDLIADMPMKICYPALEDQEWKFITGSDPKNTPWSYHNGGSWPTLLWQLSVASIKMNRPEIAERAVEVAERRIATDKWPEYYDTKRARFIGKKISPLPNLVYCRVPRGKAAPRKP